MTDIEIKQSSSGHFIFAGVLDQKTVPKIWLQRNILKAENDNIVIDLAEVSHSDSAGLAFLTCLQSEAITAKQQLSFINIPQQLKQLIELGRLDDILNI